MAKTIYGIAREYRDKKCGVTKDILFPVMLGLYNKIQFNGDDIDYAVEYGANAVLEEIEKELPKSDKCLNDYGKALVWRLKNCIEQLKK